MLGRASALLPALGIHPAPASGLASPPPTCHRLTPLPATLPSRPEAPGNPVALSPLFATLTRIPTPKSCSCHSYEKLPGRGALRGTPLDQRPSFLGTPASRANSFALIFFRTLLRSPIPYISSFQLHPHSFQKTPGGGGDRSPLVYLEPQRGNPPRGPRITPP